MVRNESDRPPPSGRKQRDVVTIHEVAARAKVSPMTVSRVINKEKNVRPSTRAAVEAAVKALNYQPNRAARTLAGVEAPRVGLVYVNPSAAFLSEFLAGALDESSRTSVQLVLEKCDPTRAGAERDVVGRLVDSGVAGVILPPPLCESEEVLDEIRKAGLPFVALASGDFDGKASCVRIDNYAAAKEMTNYLLDMGHRRIGFIKGNPDQTASAKRTKGFVDALAAANVRCDPALMIQGYFTYRSGLEAAKTLLSPRTIPTAIFASNDDMAAAVVSVAHGKGLDVPGDLSVVGFDDTAIATTIWPELTTIRQPVAKMAEDALDVIVGAIRAHKQSGVEAKAVDRLLPHSLEKRESAAPPPKAV